MLPFLPLFAAIAYNRISEECEMHSKYYWYCCEDCMKCSHRRNCEDFGDYIKQKEK